MTRFGTELRKRGVLFQHIVKVFVGKIIYHACELCGRRRINVFNDFVLRKMVGTFESERRPDKALSPLKQVLKKVVPLLENSER